MSAVAIADSEDLTPLELAFPDIPCHHTPKGPYVLVQIRLAKEASAGGIILSDFDRDTERANTQVCKVVALGPGCFRDRHTGEAWPEGDWFTLGDFMRCPKYGGDRWSVRFTRQRGALQRKDRLILPPRIERIELEFAVFKDLDLRAGVDDPLAVEAYF